jgi:HNH endonuclease
MWPLATPTRLVGSVLTTCVSNIADPAAKTAYEDTAPLLLVAEDQFRTAAQNNSLYQFPTTTMVGTRTAKEMGWLYTQKMADPKAPGRAIYDEIRMAAPNGRCPLCGRGVVYTLDHHLPKAHYPDLAVTPINLVPACQDCNKNKTSASPAMAAEETLHPYFDNVEGDIWLHARVIEVAPAAVFFSVFPPAIWSPTLALRVRNHFNTSRLRPLYASLAAEEVSNIRTLLAGPYARSGPQGVREYLTSVSASHRETRRNTWQAAAYSAMASSDWFCAEGFALRG